MLFPSSTAAQRTRVKSMPYHHLESTIIMPAPPHKHDHDHEQQALTKRIKKRRRGEEKKADENDVSLGWIKIDGFPRTFFFLPAA